MLLSGNRYYVWVAAVGLGAALLVGCGARGKSQSQSVDVPTLQTQSKRETFALPQVPPALQGEAAKAYVREHIWDGFDFADTVQFATLDEKKVARAFAYYAATLSAENCAECMRDLMQRASASKRMLDYFTRVAERVLHNPNSAARDDEKYIPVLEFLLESPLLDEYEKMPYKSDLHIAQQNRVGCIANDFVYTTADGKKSRLSILKADYTIILISNPDCPMCRDIKQQIEESALLAELIDEGRIKILVIYPDEDLDLWREHLDDYPPNWINAYDDVLHLTTERSYDLRAIPALYLLDKEKRVMAKDCTDVSYIENLISQSE